jgi:hypothetical protein
MIRKLKSGGYRLYSRKKDAKTGRRRNLGIQDARGGAKTRARGAVFQARRQITAERVEWAFWENWSAIVKPDLRGRGYGLRIWQAGMKRLGSRVIGLDGVTTQQDNYQIRICARSSKYPVRWNSPCLQQFGMQNSFKSTSRGSSR